MAVSVTTITNLSKQAVPILVSEIPLSKASASSGLAASEARQLLIQPGAELTVETRRVDLGQLEQLRRKGLLSFTTA